MMEPTLEQPFDLQSQVVLFIFLVTFGLALRVVWWFIKAAWNNFWE